MFYDNNDHSDYLGFTWQRCMIGKVPVGIDSNDTDFNLIGKTGGEKTHTLSIQEMPSHSHRILGTPVRQSTSGATLAYGGSDYGGTSTWAEQNSGGGEAHNILQPYEVVSYWRRIS